VSSPENLVLTPEKTANASVNYDLLTIKNTFVESYQHIIKF